MSQPDPATPLGGLTPPVRLSLEAIVLAAAFAVAHTQSPLYYSNQNQYLLHGAALAGHGQLERDWLAATRDPTPLFSALVAVVYSLHPWLLQPAYFALLMGYFLAARWLVAAVPGFPDSRPARITFAALFTAAHAAILRWASVQLTGVDYPWYLQAGLAAQYLLGPGIQPSAFGVLLLVALAAFVHGRPLTACALAAGACWFHSTYLLPAALLVSGFLLELSRRGGARAALRPALVALAVAAPVVAFTLWRFDPFGADAANAIRILARTRIPHHCVVTRWFDPVAGLQLLWIVFALLLVRGTPLSRVLFAAGVLGGILSALQYATGSDRLALAFPWRVSALLVPAATAVVIAVGVGRLKSLREALSPCGEAPPSPRGGEGKSGPPGQWGERLALVGLLALVAGGVAVMACGLGYQTGDEGELYAHVRASAGPDDVYLLPVRFPAVGTGRGAVSNTFAPPPRARPGTNQIPVDLQRFRLASGARVYVDFKSVPYAPREVVEWHRRMTLASELTANGTWDGRRDELKREGITHVVSPADKPLATGYLEEVHRDGAYLVYRVR